jgi:SAM-dependent methyltransferase
MTQAAGSTVFGAYSDYYDLLYRDKDYAGEAAYVRDLLARHGVAGGQLLEFGAGTGKHGELLAGMGYGVLGIERSAEMVARCPRSAGFECRQGDIREVRLARRFDAVLSLFHVVSYQTANDDVLAVFRSAAEHLAPGGLFIFDFWYTPAVYRQYPEVRTRRIAAPGRELLRIAEPTVRSGENRVDVHYTICIRDTATDTIRMITETHPMRHFSLPEIDLLCGITGFRRLAAEEFLSGQPASEGTWGVCVVLQRQEQ